MVRWLPAYVRTVQKEFAVLVVPVAGVRMDTVVDSCNAICKVVDYGFCVSAPRSNIICLFSHSIKKCNFNVNCVQISTLFVLDYFFPRKLHILIFCIYLIFLLLFNFLQCNTNDINPFLLGKLLICKNSTIICLFFHIVIKQNF